MNSREFPEYFVQFYTGEGHPSCDSITVQACAPCKAVELAYDLCPKGSKADYAQVTCGSGLTMPFVLL